MTDAETAQSSNAANRIVITACVMAATLMQTLDTTIVNIAMPYIQGSLSASLDQITWILTSYIVAAAIMTPPVGWLSARFGRKNLFVASLAGFTVASMLCGTAETLTEIVVYRAAQGVFGAALVPLSQSTMLDIFPPAQRGQAMAFWVTCGRRHGKSFFDVSAALVGCGHVSGLLMRRVWPLALMLCADRVPIVRPHLMVR